MCEVNPLPLLSATLQCGHFHRKQEPSLHRSRLIGSCNLESLSMNFEGGVAIVILEMCS